MQKIRKFAWPLIMSAPFLLTFPICQICSRGPILIHLFRKTLDAKFQLEQVRSGLPKSWKFQYLPRNTSCINLLLCLALWHLHDCEPFCRTHIFYRSHNKPARYASHCGGRIQIRDAINFQNPSARAHKRR